MPDAVLVASKDAITHIGVRFAAVPLSGINEANHSPRKIYTGTSSELCSGGGPTGKALSTSASCQLEKLEKRAELVAESVWLGKK